MCRTQQLQYNRPCNTSSALAAGVASPSQTLAPGVVFCIATAYNILIFSQPSDPGGSSLIPGTKHEIFNFLILYFRRGKKYRYASSNTLAYLSYQNEPIISKSISTNCPQRDAQDQTLTTHLKLLTAPIADKDVGHKGFSGRHPPFLVINIIWTSLQSHTVR